MDFIFQIGCRGVLTFKASLMNGSILGRPIYQWFLWLVSEASMGQCPGSQELRVELRFRRQFSFSTRIDFSSEWIITRIEQNMTVARNICLAEPYRLIQNSFQATFLNTSYGHIKLKHPASYSQQLQAEVKNFSFFQPRMERIKLCY